MVRRARWEGQFYNGDAEGLAAHKCPRVVVQSLSVGSSVFDQRAKRLALPATQTPILSRRPQGCFDFLVLHARILHRRQRTPSDRIRAMKKLLLR